MPGQKKSPQASAAAGHIGLSCLARRRVGAGIGTDGELWYDYRNTSKDIKELTA